MDEPILNIVGEKVALGPVRRDLATLYQRWMNDFEVTRLLGQPTAPRGLEYEHDWLDRVTRAIDPATFTVYERATMRPIGNTDLRDIDHRHGTALFGIVIGERDCWNKGYGAEATRLVLGYGFNVLGLHNIMLHVYAPNLGAIHAYERAGFKPMGRRRGAHMVGRERVDSVYMDCTAGDFNAASGGATA